MGGRGLRGDYGRGWRGERDADRVRGEGEPEEAPGVVAEVVQPLEQLRTLRLTSHSSPEYVRWAGGSGRRMQLYWSQGSSQQVQELECSRNWPCSPHRGRCSSFPQPSILREKKLWKIIGMTRKFILSNLSNPKDRKVS